MAILEANFNPSRRELRQFSGIWFPAFAGLVGGLVTYGGSLGTGVLIWVIAGALGAIGVFKPPFIRPVYLGLMYAVYPIGWVVSHLMLAVIFFLVFAPIGLLLRLFKYDPLRRKLTKADESMWAPYDPGAQTARYFRQY